MPSDPSECVGRQTSNLVPTCTVELTSDVVPSIQYQCQVSGTPKISSVMVHATDPESGIRAPFKLVPGKGCQDICHYKLGGSKYTVGDIKLTHTTIRIGATEFSPDQFLCQEETN